MKGKAGDEAGTLQRGAAGQARRSRFVQRAMGSHGGLKQGSDVTIGIWKAHSGVWWRLWSGD